MVIPVSNQLFATINFTLEITKDGSPTLRLGTSQESMHHFDGAASETWFVYGSVLKSALKIVLEKNMPSFKVASIGLGLGYVELSWALILSEYSSDLSELNLTLDSFEIVDDLRNRFLEWIGNNASESDSVYDLALLTLQSASHLSMEQPNQVKKMINPTAFTFHANLLEYKVSSKWNFICFDAFSKNTDAHLWTEDYLEYFLNQHAAADCVFTTYAATSILKKVLIKNNFQLIRRLGYSGKRECTLAVRGQFTDGFVIFQTF